MNKLSGPKLNFSWVFLVIQITLMIELERFLVRPIVSLTKNPFRRIINVIWMIKNTRIYCLIYILWYIHMSRIQVRAGIFYPLPSYSLAFRADKLKDGHDKSENTAILRYENWPKSCITIYWKLHPTCRAPVCRAGATGWGQGARENPLSPPGLCRSVILFQSWG